MILDSLDHIENYKGLGRVYDALKFLAETDFSEHAIGRFELADDMYYMVQEYATKPDNKTEAHKQYIDVQCIISGREVIAVAPIQCEKTVTEVYPERDVWFYDCKTEPLTLEVGMYMVLWPNDLHKPGLTLGEPVNCRKVVVKVKM